MRAMNLLGTLIKPEAIVGVTPILQNPEVGPHFVILTSGQPIPIMLQPKGAPTEEGKPSFSEADLKSIDDARNEVVMYLKKG